MTPINQMNCFLLSALICGFIIIAGCRSTGMERSNDTRISLQTMDGDITSAMQQVDATGASLGELIRSGQPDLKKALEVFSDNVTQLISTETTFARHAGELTARGTDYFEEWQKEGTEYSNPQIQQLSEQRRSILGGLYSIIAKRSIGVNVTFKTYVSDMTEIRMFLSNDLSANGMTAIAPISRQVISDGDSLRRAMQSVQYVIRRARTEMAQSGSDE